VSADEATGKAETGMTPTDAPREDREASTRALVAIPAYNEEATIADVVAKSRAHLPGLDLLVVDDGSVDGTSDVLRGLGVTTARHCCNLGYGRAIQTALKFALRHGYDALITLDADGQHDPAPIGRMYEAAMRDGWDVLIGSRYVKPRTYAGSPLGRRLGMKLFSVLVHLVARQRIYDTTSGLKVIRRTVFEPLVRWHFVDFHAEAIVYLMRLGYRVGEHPITAAERRHGESMYSALSHITYPLKTSLMILLGLVEAELTRDGRR
jgi:glycosyltransferase involved in cell wall biosynthesis